MRGEDEREEEEANRLTQRDGGAGSGRTRVQAWRLWHAAQVGMDSISHSQAWARGPQWHKHTHTDACAQADQTQGHLLFPSSLHAHTHTVDKHRKAERKTVSSDTA